MTNGEKFKTAEERAKGYALHCNICFDKFLQPKDILEWLDLEYRAELKRCPFCGGTPVMADNVEKMRSLSYFVRCACGARTVSALSESVVAEIWNRRAK
jgi:Lar family restriction alleviation protein